MKITKHKMNKKTPSMHIKRLNLPKPIMRMNTPSENKFGPNITLQHMNTRMTYDIKPESSTNLGSQRRSLFIVNSKRTSRRRHKSIVGRRIVPKKFDKLSSRKDKDFNRLLHQ